MAKFTEKDAQTIVPGVVDLRIDKVNIECLMIAAGQNLKRILRYSGKLPMPAILASLVFALRRDFSSSADPTVCRTSAFLI